MLKMKAITCHERLWFSFTGICISTSLSMYHMCRDPRMHDPERHDAQQGRSNQNKKNLRKPNHITLTDQPWKSALQLGTKNVLEYREFCRNEQEKARCD